MKKRILFILLSIGMLPAYSQKERVYRIESGEKWYGALVNDGERMPYRSGDFIDLNGDTKGNQGAPLLLSSKGHFIWSENPFSFELTDTAIIISHYSSDILYVKGGGTLRDAYIAASGKFFPPEGGIPDTLMFARPQYNTWIELVYNQNQKDIIRYANDIVKNGFPPGVLMIDDNWAPYYGRFEFRKDRFVDAKKMIDYLHELGFKVMVWVCPFVSPDTEEFRYLLDKKLVLMDNEGNPGMKWASSKTPLIVHWWNGYSSVMDFSNPDAVNWYQSQLDTMTKKYGVDGFKFDAGDAEFYTENALPYTPVNSNQQSTLWGNLGLKYPLNEYRAMWKNGGKPLGERLRDKLHTWEDLRKLIPDITVAGLLGYAYTCPDMIGGGDFISFEDGAKLDQDLIVRSAQCQALMPMMQFSVAPWRVLDQVHLDAVKKAVATRMKFVSQILTLARESAQTGEPIVRNMEYGFPDQGFEECKDQFMLGENILVAPMLHKGTKRSISFPKGEWKTQTGKIITGPAVREFDVPLSTLLYFERIKTKH